MKSATILKVTALYLLLFSAISGWYFSNELISGGHLNTLLGHVCPVSLPDTALAEPSVGEHIDCPRLVKKVLHIKNLNNNAASIFFFSSIISGMIGVYILSRRREGSD